MLKDLSMWIVGGSLVLAGCIVIDDDEDGGHDESDTNGDDDDGTDTAEDEDDTGTEDDTSTDDGDDDTGTTDTGTSDGGPSGTCGWGPIDGDPGEPTEGYVCEGEGPDPDGVFPMDCPDGLVVGGSCGDVTGVGCCDDEGDLWYCTGTDELYRIECA